MRRVELEPSGLNLNPTCPLWLQICGQVTLSVPQFPHMAKGAAPSLISRCCEESVSDSLGSVQNDGQHWSVQAVLTSVNQC